jgi:glycosyltransferase involved in cell wall biosynthesis
LDQKEVKILGVIVGDPFDHKTWSGSSRYFFYALKEKGYLYKAISAELPTMTELFYKIKSFHPSGEKWRFRYEINTKLYEQMTKIGLAKISQMGETDYNILLQVGAWYDFSTRPNKPTISYHDGNLATLLNSPYGYPKIRNSLIRQALDYEKRVYQKLDHIFPMSQWLADSFVKDFEIDTDKITPVGAGINLPFTKPVSAKKYELPRILFVGVQFDRKGGRYLLDAFQRVRREIKHAELVIVGPSLKDLPEGVRNVGRISKADWKGLNVLLDQYVNASIFVMPSLYEPFGIVFAEAMAHRLPCIGTQVCAIPEIIDDGVNGFLVQPRDSKELAQRILDLLKDAKACNEFGENAHTKYSQNYTWEAVADKIGNRILELF